MYQLDNISIQSIKYYRCSTPSRYLYEACFFALDQRFHPFFGLLSVVDLGPGVPSSEPIHLTIFVAHRVIILYTIRQKKLCTFLTRLPPSITLVRTMRIF